MMLIDRELGFSEDISSITIVKVVKHPDQVEVEVKVEGWATHPEISIGAVLPASPAKRLSWSTWKFYCAEKGDTWTIIEKYKVDEGFMG